VIIEANRSFEARRKSIDQRLNVTHLRHSQERPPQRNPASS
jgi:hypothetical protein